MSLQMVPTRTQASETGRRCSCAAAVSGNAVTERSTTRVSKPPGGTSSIFFDDGAAVAPSKKRSGAAEEHMSSQCYLAAGSGGGEEPLKLQQRHAELCAQGGRRQSYRHNASSIVIG
mmetsp:Transcript_33173/g.73989  ORF Transcript_33173/g.73989 Transcript_33173/m.73989 type:complete len:117 (+) Transcript_33173:169-519(+)